MAQQTTPAHSAAAAAWARAEEPSPAAPSAPAPAPASGVRRVGRRVESADRADLPERCACCGDSFELHAFRTIPGKVRYYVCREHLISSIARMAIGAAMLCVAAWAIVGGNVSGRSAQLAFSLIALGGAAMMWFALPVRAGRIRHGWRSLHGVCAAVRNELK